MLASNTCGLPVSLVSPVEHRCITLDIHEPLDVALKGFPDPGCPLFLAMTRKTAGQDRKKETSRHRIWVEKTAGNGVSGMY